MASYELAQLNIAMMKQPLDSPEMADFVNNLDRINALAEQSPGFIWRLKTEEGDATAIRPLGDKTLVNLSVWKDVAALQLTRSTFPPGGDNVRQFQPEFLAPTCS